MRHGLPADVAALKTEVIHQSNPTNKHATTLRRRVLHAKYSGEERLSHPYIVLCLC